MVILPQKTLYAAAKIVLNETFTILGSGGKAQRAAAGGTDGPEERFPEVSDAVVKPQPAIGLMKRQARSSAKAAITKCGDAEHTDVQRLWFE